MKRTLGLSLIVLQLATLQGCKGLLKKAATEVAEDKVDNINQPDSLDPTSSSLLDGLRLRLGVTDLSADAKEKIVSGARAELESAKKGARSSLNLAALNMESDGLDFKTKLSLVVKGAAKAMANIDELNSGGKRLGVLKDVVKFGVESTKKFQAEIGESGTQSVIADVVKTLVANVDSAGVSESERADAVVSMVGSAVSALKDAAVEGDTARIDSMKAIVDAAVSAIADAGVATTAMTEVVADIAESSLKSAAEAGVSQEQIAEAAKEVTQVAVASATRLAESANISEIKATEISAAVVENVVAALADAGVEREALAEAAAAVAGASVAALVEMKVDAAVIEQAQTEVNDSAKSGLESSGQLTEAEILEAQKEIASTTSSATAAVVENKAPTISFIGTQWVDQGQSTKISFSISDPDDSLSCSNVFAISGDDKIIPNSSNYLSIWSNTGNECTLVVTTSPAFSGSTSIQLLVTDRKATSTSKFEIVVRPASYVTFRLSSDVKYVAWQDGDLAWQPVSLADCSDFGCSKTMKVSDKMKRAALSMTCESIEGDYSIMNQEPPSAPLVSKKYVRTTLRYGLINEFYPYEELNCWSKSGPYPSATASIGTASEMPDPEAEPSKTPTTTVTYSTSTVLGRVSLASGQCLEKEICQAVLISKMTDENSSYSPRFYLREGDSPLSVAGGNYRAVFIKRMYSTDDHNSGVIKQFSYKDVAVGAENLILDPSKDAWTPVSFEKKSVSFINFPEDMNLKNYGSAAGVEFGYLPLSHNWVMNPLPFSGFLEFLNLMGTSAQSYTTQTFFELIKKAADNSFDSFHISMNLLSGAQQMPPVDLSGLPNTPTFSRIPNESLSVEFPDSDREVDVMFSQGQPDQTVQMFLYVSGERMAMTRHYKLPSNASSLEGWQSDWGFLDQGRISVSGRSSYQIGEINIMHRYERFLMGVAVDQTETLTRDGVCYGILPENAVARSYEQTFDWTISDWTPPIGTYWTDMSSSYYGGNSSYYGSSSPYPVQTPQCRFTCNAGLVFSDGRCVPAVLKWGPVQDVESTRLRTGHVVGKVSNTGGGLATAVMEGTSVALMAAETVFVSRNEGENWESSEAMSGKSDARIAFGKDNSKSLLMTYRDEVTSNSNPYPTLALKMRKLDSSRLISDSVVSVAQIIANKVLFTASNGHVFSTFVVSELSAAEEPQLLRRLKVARSTDAGETWQTVDLSLHFSGATGSLESCDEMSSFQMAESSGKLLLVQHRNCETTSGTTSGTRSIASAVLSDLSSENFGADLWSPMSRYDGVDSSFFNGKVVGRSDGFRIYSNWQMGSYLLRTISQEGTFTWERHNMANGKSMVTLTSSDSETVYFSNDYLNGLNQLGSIRESSLSTSQNSSNSPPIQLVASDASSMSRAVAVGDSSQIHVFWLSFIDNDIRHAKLSGSGEYVTPPLEVDFEIANRTLAPLNDSSMGGNSLSGDSIGEQAFVIAGAKAFQTSDSGATWQVSQLFGSGSWLTSNTYSYAKKVIADGGKFHLFADGVYAFNSDLNGAWTVRSRVPSFPDRPWPDFWGQEWAVSGVKVVIPSVSCQSLDPTKTEISAMQNRTELYLIHSENSGDSWATSSGFDLSAYLGNQECIKPEFYSVKIQQDSVLLMYKVKTSQGESLGKAVWTASTNSWTSETLLAGDAGTNFYIINAVDIDGGVLIKYSSYSQELSSYFNSSLVLVSTVPSAGMNSNYGRLSRCVSVSGATLCPAGNGGVLQRLADSTEWTLKPVDAPLWGMQLLLKFSTAAEGTSSDPTPPVESVSLIYQNPVDGFLKVSGSTDDGNTWE